MSLNYNSANLSCCCFNAHSNLTSYGVCPFNSNVHTLSIEDDFSVLLFAKPWWKWKETNCFYYFFSDYRFTWTIRSARRKRVPRCTGTSRKWWTTRYFGLTWAKRTSWWENFTQKYFLLFTYSWCFLELGLAMQKKIYKIGMTWRWVHFRMAIVIFE